jgi:hypothetical protein
MKATISLDPTPRVESRDETFPYRPGYWRGIGSPDWDVSPDDQRILAVRPLGETSNTEGGRYVVVQNFSELLRQVEPE